jgi:hypothetical protein
VGIRVTVASIDVDLRSADLDLTMYTRGYGPSGAAGSPFLGYPALDYGDGSTVSTATLALTNTGGGPGGSNVYRSLASFSHTYPGLGLFTARAAMACVACFQSSYAVFPIGSPVPTAFTGTLDYRPTSVIGNLPVRLTFSGTTSTFFSANSVRYLAAVYPVVTNTTPVVFDLEIPTASDWGLVALGASLLAAGLVLLRRCA